MAGKAIDMSDSMARYPRTVVCDGIPVLITAMQPQHEAEVQAFVARLPPHDLLFLRKDIGQPRVLSAWMDGLREGSVQSLVAHAGGELAGCTGIVSEKLSWAAHVGELRVLVGGALRGKGLGRVLVQECFAQALTLGLEKLCAQMTVDQAAAIALFEELGFRAEALLRKHVRDRDGRLHDLVLMSHDVREFHATLHAYGVTDALAAPASGRSA
jgi:L-amino acid N-acyltransferase YncA